MYESNTRDKILKKIRQALLHKSPNPFPEPDFASSVFAKSTEAPEIIFAENFSNAGGHFIFCEDRYDFAEELMKLCVQKSLKNIICPESHLASMLDEFEIPFQSEMTPESKAHAIITSCETLVALTGSILVTSKNDPARLAPFVSQVHIVVAYSHQIKMELKNALRDFKTKYKNNFPSSFTFITGATVSSENAGQEIKGATANEIFLFLIDQPEQYAE